MTRPMASAEETMPSQHKLLGTLSLSMGVGVVDEQDSKDFCVQSSRRVPENPVQAKWQNQCSNMCMLVHVERSMTKPVNVASCETAGYIATHWAAADGVMPVFG